MSLLPAFGYTLTTAQLNAVRHIHDVAAVAVIRFDVLVPVHSPANLSPAAAVDSAMGNAVDRSRLVAGRRANPGAADEMTIGETLAARLHQGVAGPLEFLSYTPAQVATAGGGAEKPPTPAGPRVRLRIVGIVRRQPLWMTVISVKVLSGWHWNTALRGGSRIAEGARRKPAGFGDHSREFSGLVMKLARLA